MNIQKLLAAALAACLMFGCGKKADQPEPAEDGTGNEPAEQAPENDPYLPRAESIAAELSLKQKIEQLLVVAVSNYNGAPFQSINSEIEAMFADHQYGGMILFDDNIRTPGQTAGLNHDLQCAAVQNNGIPLLIAVDQEGGYLVRGSGVTDTPGNMALGASGEPRLAGSAASILATEIAAMGFNTDFAPDADVNSEPANPIIGIRSFSDDPMKTADFALAFAKGLADNGIVSCGKHFPGHGNVDTDSHTGLPVSEATLEDLRGSDLIPFARLADGGTDMIMTAHIRFPNVETETYTSKLDGSEITLPATLSRTFLTDVLRGELGYEGVAITDSMGMGAIKDHFDPVDAAVLALNAGDDMLLMPVHIEDAQGIAELDAYVDTLVSLVNDRIPEERINEAVVRVLTMKARRGILDYDVTRDRTGITEYADAFVGCAENHESERAIADQCVTVVKNQDVLPFTGNGHYLIAGIQESQRAALERGFRQLAGETGCTADFMNLSYGKNMPGSLAGYDGVIVTSWLNNMSQFDPSESVMIPQIRTLIQNAHLAGIPCVVISTELPYELSCYEEADALMAVYNPLGIRFDDAGGQAGAAGPNLAAALDIIFGHTVPSATLPVNVPYTEGTGFSEETAYPRGTGLTW